MNPIFTRSAQTTQILALFKELQIDKVLSFSAASKAVGFEFGASSGAYQSARRIAVNEFGIVVEGVRGFGFMRLAGTGIVKRADSHLSAIRRRARRGSREVECAIAHNLSREDMLLATEKLSRLRIAADAASPVKAISNKVAVEQPPKVESFDMKSALRAVQSK